MNFAEYTAKISMACHKAGNGIGWNARFLYWLDVFELMLKPDDWKDPTNQNMDMQAPRPFPEEQVSWPHCKIGDKNEV
jgi:hypothetical protein